MEILNVSIIKEKKIVKNVLDRKYVYIIIIVLLAENVMEVHYVNMVKKLHAKYVLVLLVANTEKLNITARTVTDLLFASMENENQDVKRVVEKVYVKRHCAKQEQAKNTKATVSVVLFIYTPTDQTHATTRPRNAPWSMSC